MSTRASSGSGQDAPKPAEQKPATQAPRKKTIKTTKDVNGVPQEIEIEVDDVEDPTWGPRGSHRLLGTDLRRVDAALKVSGRARYTHDVRLPGMVWARLFCSPWPQGTVRVDTSKATAIPGVEAAIVLKDKIGYLGDPLVAVAARTSELADDALRALVVEHTPTPFVLTRDQGLAEGAPKVKKRGNEGELATSGSKAEAEQALAGAAAVVEATYTVPVQHHASLETHGVVVDYRGGDSATLYLSTQHTISAGEDAARELGLKTSQVTSVVEHRGGGFGSKFGLGVEGAAACKLAKQLGKPVHLMLTRADEFVTAGNRSGNRATLKGGISADGKLVALVARAEKHGGIGDGSYPRPPYIYAFEKAYSERVAIYTHTDSSRAMRAPGHPQASFGMESLVDELAYKAGLDPLEVRKRNMPVEADGQPSPWVRQLERCAREIGWYEHPNRTQPGAPSKERCVGIGFGIATWGGGSREGNLVDVRIHPDGAVTASVATQDLGTGTRTYLSAIVAEELGLPLEAVEARIGSSTYPEATGSGGSTTTAGLAPAVKHGAWLARTKLAEHLAGVLKTDAALLRFENGRVGDPSDAKKSLSWSQACAALPKEGLSARGEWQSSLMGNGVHGAQAAKVEVDTVTGRVRVLAMVGVQDCGFALNRMAVKSQINGGMIQALSYALLEERVLDTSLGFALNANLEEYKLAGPTEIPELTAIIDDEDTREVVIGMAEPAIIPGHSAIANAVFNACGARVRDLPLTPDKVLAALAQRG
jgi:xanthine dehydrogenase YagR molybdenum-binding subunit